MGKNGNSERLYFGGLQNHCRHLLLGIKVMTNIDRTLKGRDVTLSTKVHLVIAIFFPVVMYRCEIWTINKAQCRRIDAFELWCWRRFWKVPWAARRYNLSILKEINPEYSLQGLMLKLKVQYYGHLIRRPDSLERALMLGKIEGRRRKGGRRMRWLDSIIDSCNMSWSKLQEMVDKEAWHVAVPGFTKSRTSLSNWTRTRNTQVIKKKKIVSIYQSLFLLLFYHYLDPHL